MFLPDVNLWLALAFDKHVHHLVAKNWFGGIPDGDCSFCRMTQQGFLRLATNPKVLGSEAVTLADAWRLYDRLLSDPRVAFALEPEGIEPLWRGHTRATLFSPNVWNDAYLAAFAQAVGYGLVTFDRGFAKFAGLACTIL
jgi:uncharacterized protein